MQAELSQTITGLQTEASAAWFDAGIAAQEAFTAPLKAAMDAAQTQVLELTRQKDLALGILEAWNEDQTALLDAEAARMEAVRGLIPAFEAKIARTLARVWGTAPATD